MTLAELITELTETTGRTDLTQARIIQYLKNGQKFLDDYLGNTPFDPIPYLEDLTDENWWSQNYPQTLIRAACMRIEMDYRNSEGVKDELTAIKLDLQGIDFSNVEEECRDIDVLEG